MGVTKRSQSASRGGNSRTRGRNHPGDVLEEPPGLRERPALSDRATDCRGLVWSALGFSERWWEAFFSSFFFGRDVRARGVREALVFQAVEVDLLPGEIDALWESQHNGWRPSAPHHPPPSPSTPPPHPYSTPLQSHHTTLEKRRAVFTMIGTISRSAARPRQRP